ncbi:MAG: SPOR domain-containing protein [Gammaproteobacteria bacterium]|nr:SPOR domain-containing protein [Gammaproteobacteria bacterium]MDH3857238.1 SPOR domain-containing protein [Gammaproteobacteria bacterium]
MDQNIKNRLVGISVVFALAVIFLPMVLDGSGVRKDKFEVVIPPQPLVSANPEFEPKIIDMQAKVEALPDLESRLVDENSSPTRIKPADTGKVDLKSEKTTQPEPETRQALAKDEKVTAAKEGGDSWVLQVGSFQDRDKALSQRDKLRKSNISAVFIEQFEVDNKPSFRVRLGPFINRDQTQVAQNKIKAKHNIDGIIMKYER